MGSRNESLVDVLARALLQRDDAPEVDYWGAALRPSDVHQQVERVAAPPAIVPVILGTSS